MEAAIYPTERTSFSWKINRVAKRSIDIVVSFLGIVLLMPLFLLVAFLIRRDSDGPILFWCRRMGRYGQPFKMLKFRTMFERPSSYQGPPVTCDGDDRITPIGQWLRDTKINELPQLWNVLIGQMSLVGPRPEDVGIANKWPKDIRAEILSVRPGITSPASVLYHDEEHRIQHGNVVEDYIKNILPDKLRLDQLYVRNQSITTDFDIIFWTIAIFVPQIARAKIPEGVLFFGPISGFFHHYVSWFFIDLVTSLLAVTAIGFLWRLQMPLNWGIYQLGIFAVFIACLFSSVNSLTGLNRILWSSATTEDAAKLVLSSTSVTFVILLLNYINSILRWIDLETLPIVMILAIGLFAQIGFLITRFRSRTLTSIASRWLQRHSYTHGVGENVLIVGLGDDFNTAVWLLKRGEFRYLFNIVGVVDDATLRRRGMWINGCLVLGMVSDIPDLVKKYDIGIVILTSSEISDQAKGLIHTIRQNTEIRVAHLPQMLSSLSQQITQSIPTPERFTWAQDQPRYFALYDPTTGLPNRFFFGEQLQRSLAYARRYHAKLVVLLISIDEKAFRHEELGLKDQGKVLKVIADRLLQHKRESDTLAYLGNNEFGLILENIPAESVVAKIAQRVHALTSEPIQLETEEVNLIPQISMCVSFEAYEGKQKYTGEELDFFLQVRKPIPV